MQPLKVQRSHLGISSFLGSQKSYRSYFDDNFSVINEENAKNFNIIENKAKQMKQREKLAKEIIRKFRKIYQEQVKKFQQLQKVSNLALQQKSSQLEFLSIQNTQLKEERIELQAIKQEKQSLAIRYEKLQEQNTKLNKQLQDIKESYDLLKADFDQKSQLLQNGIRSNQIETQQSTTNDIQGSMRQVQQLNNALQEQKNRQIQQAISKEQQKLKATSLQISEILSSFLRGIPVDGESSKQAINTQSNLSQKAEGNKLGQLAQELKRKSDEISRVIVNSHEIWKNLKQKQSEVLKLSINLKDYEQKIQQKNQQIESLKNELQFIDQQSKIRVKTEETQKQNLTINYEQFQQDLTQLIKAKTLQQYKNFYDLIITTSSEIFSTFKDSLNERDKTGEFFIKKVMKTIDFNLIKLNDFFKQNLEKQNQKLHRMTQYITRAKIIAQKNNEQQQQLDLQQRNILAQSTPDRFSFKPAYQHQRQQSESSVKSEKKRSILLQHDMDTAVNYEDYMDSLRQEALQQQLTDLKNSQVILDSLKDGQNDELGVRDSLSDSISKSQVSNLSQAEQIRGHNERKKTVMLNAKLKKKKKN